MKNRRRHPRFTVEGLHGQLTFTSVVEVLNLSLGGAALRVDKQLVVGSEYTLKLDVGDQTVEVKVAVAWAVLSGMRGKVTGEEIPIYSVGMKFTDIFTEKLVRLMEFIDRHKIFEEHRLGGMRFQIDAPGKAILDLPQSYRVKLISFSGMLIETERGLEKDKRYPMEVALQDGASIRFRGRVASNFEVAGPPKRYEIGIEFMEMSDTDEERLQDFLRSLSAPEPGGSASAPGGNLDG